MNRWINVAAITHVDFDEKLKKATVYIGLISAVGGSAEAYEYFRKEDGVDFAAKSIA